MKDYFKYYITSSVIILLIFACLLMSIIIAKAQDNKQVMQKAPASVNIDGKLTEWSDSLALHDATTKLNYTIANDDSDLYVIAFVTDPQVKRKIMAGGITIAINTEGKKHKTFNMTYPVPDKVANFATLKDDANPDNFIRKPSLIESTSIRVSGFKDVESDIITTANTYGFKAALNFDDKHNLVYETAIPLKMLYLKPGKNNELAINISVNGIEHKDNKGQHGTGGSGRGGEMEGGGIGGGGGMSGGMSGGGRGMGGGSRGGSRGGNRGAGQYRSDPSGSSQATDFWVKLTLAPH